MPAQSSISPAALLHLLELLTAVASLEPSLDAYLARGAVPSDEWLLRSRGELLHNRLTAIFRQGLGPVPRRELADILNLADLVAEYLRDYALDDWAILAGPDRYQPAVAAYRGQPWPPPRPESGYFPDELSDCLL